MEAEISERSGVFSENDNKATTITKNYTETKTRFSSISKKPGKVLVLDDFHYAPEEIAVDMPR